MEAVVHRSARTRHSAWHGWFSGEPPVPGVGKEGLQGKICWKFIPLR